MTIQDNQGALENLGSKIRRIRTEGGIGQERLAIEANVDQSGLSKFERGKDRRMSQEALARIAVILGLTYEQLIQGTEFTSEAGPKASTLPLHR